MNSSKFRLFIPIKWNLLLSLIIVMPFKQGLSQPTIGWERVYGGTGYEKPAATIRTTDGNIIIVGYTDSEDLDVVGQHGFEDIWVIKIDINGNLLWQRPIGGSGFDEGYGVVESNDGGYIIVGRTGSEDGDASCDFETSPYWSWIVKLDINGVIIWNKCFEGLDEGIGEPKMYSICKGVNSGYVITGSDYYQDGSGKDLWVLKINEQGEKEWEHFYGGHEWEEGFSISSTNDGGYVVCGYTESNDGDISEGENNGGSDFWILKLDDAGSLLWQKNYGSPTEDIAKNIFQLNDGNFLVVGSTYGNGGDITGTHGQQDIWTIKLNSDGNLIWQKPYGGLKREGANQIVELDSDGYLITGFTESKSGSGQVSFNHKEDKWDFWLVQIDSNGELINDLSYGSSQWEGEPVSVLLPNNEILITGYTGLGSSGPDGDVSSFYDGYDIWAIKLNNLKTNVNYLTDENEMNIVILPNPVNDVLIISVSDKFEFNNNTCKAIDIYNSTGIKTDKIRYNKIDHNQIEIDIYGYPPGLYFVLFDLNGTVFSKTFIRI